MGNEKEEITVLKRKLSVAEQSAKDSEEMMMQAAVYGKELLEKNMMLETQYEALNQEKHECNLKLQAKLDVEKSLFGEIDNLRDAVKQNDLLNQKREMEDESKWAKKEELWKAKLGEVDSALQASETREKGLVHRLEIAEKQLKEANDVLNQSVGQSFSVEFGELQSNNVELMRERQTLETELARTRAELEQEKSKVNSASAKVELLQRELEEVRCEITGYVRAVEASKTEVMELEAQMEAVRAGQLNEDGKGNSLFSEVNDRREKVETQLKVYEEKYKTLKENYDIKLAQLQKTKMHNAQLLSIAGTRGDTGHVARLEELLAAERNKNKTLRDQLASLEKLSNGAKIVTMPFSKAAKSDGDDSIVVQHTASEEYAYLSTLLTETQNNTIDLQKQLQQQVRQNLEDSDKLREMTRKVHQTETSVQRLKADNYTLRMQIDELKCKKGDQKVAKKEPVKIVEMLKFAKKEPEPVITAKSDKFVLKENVVNKPIKVLAVEKPPVIDNFSPIEDKENEVFDSENEKVKKKCAFFAETVEEISADGETESAKLKDDTPKPKIKPKKPQGKKQYGSKNTVLVSEQEGAECKQQ